MLTYSLWLPVIEDTSGYNVKATVFLYPFAAFLFQFVPVAPVQVVVLGADVSHIETFYHGLAAPFVVSCRTEVSAVPAAAFVVLCGDGFTFRQIGVGVEVVSASGISFYTFGGEFPGYPVGNAGVGVIGYEVAGALQQYFGSAGGGGLLDVDVRVLEGAWGDGFYGFIVYGVFLRVCSLVGGDDAAYHKEYQ